MTDVRSYRAGSCKPRIREETGAGREEERQGCRDRVNVGRGLEAGMARTGA